MLDKKFFVIQPNEYRFYHSEMIKSSVKVLNVQMAKMYHHGFLDVDDRYYMKTQNVQIKNDPFLTSASMSSTCLGLGLRYLNETIDNMNKCIRLNLNRLIVIELSLLEGSIWIISMSLRVLIFMGLIWAVMLNVLWVKNSQKAREIDLSC